MNKIEIKSRMKDIKNIILNGKEDRSDIIGNLLGEYDSLQKKYRKQSIVVSIK